MATIHPSRMGLIPQEMRGPASRGRSPSPRSRRRSPSPRPNRSRSGDRYNDSSRRHPPREDSRSNHRDSRERERESYRSGDKRRASPQYEDYRRPPPSELKQPENVYPERKGYNRGGPYGNVGTDFLESRRAQRAAQVVDIWPASPKAPARELSPARKKSSKKSKRHRSTSASETSSDEEDKRRRERKERKRARRREKEERTEKKHHHRVRSRSRSRERVVDEESEDKKPHRHRRRTRSPSRGSSRSKSHSVRARSPEAPERMDVDQPHRSHSPTSARPRSSSRQLSAGPPLSQAEDSDDDDEVGPQPIVKKIPGKKIDERAYGGALLRGEGSAMAAFLQDGTESRIPRRGEIGLTSDQIAKFEDAGYVMSGSRHRRMNAVRMRKENQVISAEEKRGILKLQREERARREAILREEFTELVQEKLKEPGTAGQSSTSAKQD